MIIFQSVLLIAMYIAATYKKSYWPLYGLMHISIMHVVREEVFFLLDTYVSRKDFCRTKFDWRA